MLNTAIGPSPPKLVAGLVNDGLGNRLGLSWVVLSALTGVVTAPAVFHVILMVAPDAVAVTGELEAFRDCTRAEATWLDVLFAVCPVHAEFVLLPKHAVAVKLLPIESETVPESKPRFAVMSRVLLELVAPL